MKRLPHEWPLVAFSWLAIAGAGTLVAGALGLSAGPLAPAPAARSAAAAPLGAGLVLLALGLVVSLFHLGRPLRAALALSRIGSSPLSNEMAASGLTMVLAVAAIASADGTLAGVAARLALALAAALLLVMLGLVYRLGGQRSWGGAAVAAPLVAGIAFGAVLGGLLVPRVGLATAAPRSALGFGAVVALIAIDIVVTALRWRLVRRLAAPIVAVHPSALARRHVLLAVRLLLFDAAPILLLATEAHWAAGITMAAGLLVDRVAFYGLAVRQTTEAEVAAAEAVMGSGLVLHTFSRLTPTAGGRGPFVSTRPPCPRRSPADRPARTGARCR